MRTVLLVEDEKSGENIYVRSFFFLSEELHFEFGSILLIPGRIDRSASVGVRGELVCYITKSNGNLKNF